MKGISGRKTLRGKERRKGSEGKVPEKGMKRGENGDGGGAIVYREREGRGGRERVTQKGKKQEKRRLLWKGRKLMFGFDTFILPNTSLAAGGDSGRHVGR